MALKVLDAIAQDVGPDNVSASLAFVGSQPSSYPVNTIYLWTSGPHEAVLLVALTPERTISTAALQELLRDRIDEIGAGAVGVCGPGERVHLGQSVGWRRTRCS